MGIGRRNQQRRWAERQRQAQGYEKQTRGKKDLPQSKRERGPKLPILNWIVDEIGRERAVQIVEEEFGKIVKAQPKAPHGDKIRLLLEILDSEEFRQRIESL